MLAKFLVWTLTQGENSYPRFLMLTMPAYTLVLLLMIFIGFVIMVYNFVVTCVTFGKYGPLWDDTIVPDIKAICVQEWTPYRYLTPGKWQAWRGRNMLKRMLK